MKQVCLIAVLVLSLGCEHTPPSTGVRSLTENAAEHPPSTGVSLQTVANAEQLRQRIASQRGKMVVVDFWATWCPPCIQEFPKLVALHRQRHASVTCMSVSCDTDGLDPPDEVHRRVVDFLQGHGATFDNVLVTMEADAFFREYGIASIPVVEVYDRDGTLIQRFDASTQHDRVYDEVHAIIAHAGNQDSGR